MRGFIQFLIFAAIIFFGIGEFAGGWYLGIPPQTPMFVYKNSHTTTVQRRTFNLDSFPFTLKGRLRHGTMRIEATYAQGSSFQNPGAPTSPPRKVFEEEYRKGDFVNINEVLERGGGIYTIRIVYEDATGLFNLDVPPNSEL